MSRNISSTIFLTIALSSCAVVAAPAFAGSMKWTLNLSAAGPGSGTIGLTGQSGQMIIEVDGGQTMLTALVSGLAPRTPYTIWLGFDTTQPPFVAGDSLMAVDERTRTTAPVFPFTPAAADNAGFVGGNGMDPNGFVTDDQGNAQFQVKLNYDIFQPRSAPVLLRPGASQALSLSQASGGCTVASDGTSYAAMVDTGFMRVYDNGSSTPSFQITDAPLRPRLVRGTVAGITFAEHLDGLTHGHVPGVLVGNPAAGCGDWVPRLSAPLANAAQ